MENNVFEGFYKKTINERLQILKLFSNLQESEIDLLKVNGPLSIESADKMIENVFAVHCLPVGLAVNFLIDGKQKVIPYVVEEPSVVAAASNAAKLCYFSGGFQTGADKSIMIGQIQFLEIKDIKKAQKQIEDKKEELIQLSKTEELPMVKYGGGLIEIQTRVIESSYGPMLIVHLLVDCVDSMGANTINTYLEFFAPKINEMIGGRAAIKILSNLSIYRTAWAKAIWTQKALEESTKGAIKGDKVLDLILEAYEFARVDPFRAVTHNKGIMNGISSIALATGNDWRAIEASAHAYASLNNSTYQPLTKYYKDKDGNLVGEIKVPLAVGIVGGSTTINPTNKICLKILDVKTAQELSRIMAAAGLAQNFAAIRALATEGIQRGHMKLHARNFAAAAGADSNLIDRVSRMMIEQNKISLDNAKKILEELKSKNN